MDTFAVKTESKKYLICFADNFDSLAEKMKSDGLKKNKIMIVTDDTVAKLYLKEVKDILSVNYEDVSDFIFHHGEENKNLDSVGKMYEAFLAAKLDRKSVVVALGGGVTGDMAGFAAATYMRGLRLIQVPTTLLSQVDSSVGGKTGVDFLGNKNLIGAFCQPDLVYINLSTLKTLPEEHYVSGLAEAVKAGYIADSEYLRYISDNRETIRNKDKRVLETVIQGCCKIKATIVSQDEKENGIREILNFGHTFGHAMESVTGFSIAHGYGVALGMLCAMHLSVGLGSIAEKDLESAKELFISLGLPTKLGMTSLRREELVQKIYEQMFNDKKIENNTLRLVLLSRLGEAHAKTFEDKEAVTAAINYVIDYDS